MMVRGVRRHCERQTASIHNHHDFQALSAIRRAKVLAAALTRDGPFSLSTCWPTRLSSTQSSTSGATLIVMRRSTAAPVISVTSSAVGVGVCARCSVQRPASKRSGDGRSCSEIVIYFWKSQWNASDREMIVDCHACLGNASTGQIITETCFRKRRVVSHRLRIIATPAHRKLVR